MSTNKPQKNNETYYTGQGEYPEALPSNYDPNQQGYPQYYSSDPQHQQQQQQPHSEYPQEQQQQQQGYANKRAPQNADYVNYEAPVGQQSAAPAVPAYYDYTVPQSFSDVSKFQAKGEWATPMWKAPCADPCFCVSAFFCPCCCTFLQRKKLLMDDWSRYRCCAGICGQCLCLGSNCGCCAPFCMVLETLFCLACSVHGNRYMVMQHYGLHTECCDCVIMWSACVLQIIGWILGSDFIQVLADCMYFMVLSCMLTQNEYQMKKFPYPTRSAMK